jgi:hypothetical protein
MGFKSPLLPNKANATLENAFRDIKVAVYSVKYQASFPGRPLLIKHKWAIPRDYRKTRKKSCQKRSFSPSLLFNFREFTLLRY